MVLALTDLSAGERMFDAIALQLEGDVELGPALCSALRWRVRGA